MTREKTENVNSPMKTLGKLSKNYLQNNVLEKLFPTFTEHVNSLTHCTGTEGTGQFISQGYQNLAGLAKVKIQMLSFMNTECQNPN